MLKVCYAEFQRNCLININESQDDFRFSFNKIQIANLIKMII